MLSGRQGHSLPAAEVIGFTAHPGRFYDAPVTARQLMPTNFEKGPCPTLGQICLQLMQTLRSEIERNHKNCVFQQKLPLPVTELAKHVPERWSSNVRVRELWREPIRSPPTPWLWAAGYSCIDPATAAFDFRNPSGNGNL